MKKKQLIFILFFWLNFLFGNNFNEENKLQFTDSFVNNDSLAKTTKISHTVNISVSNNNPCSGDTISFSSVVSGSGPNIYSWNFGDGSPVSAAPNPTHVFNSLGNGSVVFNVILTVTVGSEVVSSTPLSIIVKQQPNISFFDVDNPNNPFDNCNSASNQYLINVGNSSISASNITSYIVNWGDGISQPFSNSDFPISHQYTFGSFTLSITAIGSNQCIKSISYQVKNVLNPGAGLPLPPNSSGLCAFTTIPFTITEWGANSLDTTYTINYGDGPSSITYHQDQMVLNSLYYNSTNPALSLPFPIPHEYTSASCPGFFTITLTIANDCSELPPITIGVRVTKIPEALISGPSIKCYNNSPVIFTNSSTPGYNSNCNQLTTYIWDFGDPAGTNNIINTGPISTGSQPNGSHVFSAPGNYTVTLTAISQNSCVPPSSNDTHQICIEPPLVPLFTIPQQVCINTPVAIVNNTSPTNCPQSIPTYSWTITYTSGNCGTSPSYSYISNTSSSSFEPSINFAEAGIYTIKLTATNSCPSVDSPTQTITVTKPPVVSIAPINDYCGNLPYNINPQVTICKPDPYPINTIEYIWSVTPSTGVTIPSPNQENPGIIEFTLPGTYTVTLNVNNHICGNSTASQTFNIITPPLLTNTSLSQTICSSQSTTIVNLNANPSNATISWTAATTSGITGFSTSGSNTIPSEMLINPNTTSGTVEYTITTSLNGCISTATYIITVEPLPTITQPTPVITCIGGSATLSVSQITGATYEWFYNTSNNNTGGTPAPGTNTSFSYNPPTSTIGELYYYCIITNIPSASGACNSITSNAVAVTIEAIPILTIQPSTSQTICVNQNANTLSVTTSGTITPGGIPPNPTYQWYSSDASGGMPIPVATTATFSPPTFTVAGSYYYFVTVDYSNSLCGNAGVLTSAVFGINVVDAPVITSQPFSPQILCQGSTTTPSTLTITPTGLNYQWFSNTVNSAINGTPIPVTGVTSDNTFTPPTPTTLGSIYYFCAVSSITNCSTISSLAEITLVAGTSINPTVNVTQIPCYNSPPQNNGEIAIVSTIPVGYTINWTGPGISNSSASTISNLAPGNYELTIADTNGCPFVQTYTILPQPSEIIIPTATINNVSCLGGNNGSIDITPAGGTTSTGIYNYAWSLNGNLISNQQDIINLTAGTYSVIVTDDNGCQKSETFTITEPTTSITLPVLSSVTNVTCNGEATGAITINSPSGGTPNYTYNWYLNGILAPQYQNLQNISNLIAGTYSLELTDSLGCSPSLGTDLTVVISEPPPISITYTTTPVTCDGADNGSITITSILGGVPGVPPYPTVVFDGVTLTTPFLNIPFSNLSPGNYTLDVTDSVGCQKSFTIPIASPPAFNINNAVITQISCHGANDGRIALNPNIATPPITVSWTFTPFGSTTPIPFNNFALTLNNLAPGTYTVTINDGTTCPVINQSFTLNEPFPLTASISVTDALDCFNPNSGAINLIVSGGTQPYTYNGSLSLSNVTNIPPGNYSIVVDDANHCGPITVSYTIGRPTEVTVTATSTLNIDCDAKTVTRSFVAQASGGVPPYTYNWSSGVTSGAYNQFMTTNQNGLVTLNATDSRGCSALQLFTEDVTDIFSIGDFSIASDVSIGSISYGGHAINVPIEFTSTITGNFSSLSWDFGDGSPPVSSLVNEVVQHTYLNVGEFNVILTVTYGGVCTYPSNPYPITIGLGYLLVVPSAFTPGTKDNYNDTFRPVTKNLKNIQMDIYDTWGHLIYSETGDDLVGWDGKIKGYEAENGNYNYKVCGYTFYGKEECREGTFILKK